MAQPYNVSAFTKANTTVDFVRAANDTYSGGWFMTSFLVLLWIVLMAAMKAHDARTAFATASFIVAVLSMFARWASLVSDWFVGTMFIMTAIGVLMLLFRGE